MNSNWGETEDKRWAKKAHFMNPFDPWSRIIFLTLETRTQPVEVNML